jgi:hypothetical protein
MKSTGYIPVDPLIVENRQHVVITLAFFFQPEGHRATVVFLQSF